MFIFDPVRNAVLLVAGDKSGRWKEWYAEAIPAAEAAYKAYLEGLRVSEQPQFSTATPVRSSSTSSSTPTTARPWR